MGSGEKPSASDIVYLFGDRFAKGARMGGEKLIFGGSKVKHSDLGDSLMVAAFADLLSRGYLALELVEEKKLGLFSSRDVLVTRLGEPSERLYGLEAAIWDKLSGDPKRDRVRPITRTIRCSHPGQEAQDRTRGHEPPVPNHGVPIPPELLGNVGFFGGPAVRVHPRLRTAAGRRNLRREPATADPLRVLGEVIRHLSAKSPRSGVVWSADGAPTNRVPQYWGRTRLSSLPSLRPQIGRNSVGTLAGYPVGVA